MNLPKFLFFTLLFIAVKLPAQLIIGWNGGYATPHELNREIYIYDAINAPNLSKKMKPLHWNQGPYFGARLGDEKFFEFSYARKRAEVGSQFDSAGISMSRQLKVYCNTWNFIFGMKTDGWAFGLSADFGRFKGFGRRGITDGIKDKPWTRLWVLDNTRLLGIAVARLYITESVFVERDFGKFGVRMYAQLFGMREQMDGLDFWLFGTQLNYENPNEDRFTNYGLAVFLNIGRK